MHHVLFNLYICTMMSILYAEGENGVVQVMAGLDPMPRRCLRAEERRDILRNWVIELVSRSVRRLPLRQCLDSLNHRSVSPFESLPNNSRAPILVASRCSGNLNGSMTGVCSV